MNLTIALIAVVVWIVVAFGAKPESGLAHIPLAVGVVFLARAIVFSQEAPPEDEG